MDYEEQADNYYIICPFCQNESDHDVDDYKPDGSEYLRTCGKCSTEFKITVSVDTTWHTAKKDDACEICGDTGEISADEEDGEGHTMVGVDTRPCPQCRVRESEEYNDQDL